MFDRIDRHNIRLLRKTGMPVADESNKWRPGWMLLDILIPKNTKAPNAAAMVNHGAENQSLSGHKTTSQ